MTDYDRWKLREPDEYSGQCDDCVWIEECEADPSRSCDENFAIEDMADILYDEMVDREIQGEE